MDVALRPAAAEIDKVGGVEYIDRADHDTRLLAVNRFTKLLGVVLKHQ